MPVVDDPQTTIEEKQLESTDLEQALERRHARKAEKSEATRLFKESDDNAKRMLDEFQLQDGEVARCGRFRIVKKHVPGAEIAFTKSAGSRLSISPIVDESE